MRGSGSCGRVRFFPHSGGMAGAGPASGMFVRVQDDSGPFGRQRCPRTAADFRRFGDVRAAGY
ncbi:MAG: hypothetical protein A9Z00_05945 [Thermobacillus sp. ZCTH02-B1]|nr:MAG: hypothetical protein A9Z00_05945 [Thermobacillus sp. ZCTH02-B1]